MNLGPMHGRADLPHFSVKVEHPVPGTVLMSLVGDLDMDTAPELERTVAEVLRQHRPACLVLDMGALTFLDSSAIRSLLLAYSDVEQQDARFVITRVRPIVHRVLSITGLLDTFGITSIVDAA